MAKFGINDILNMKSRAGAAGGYKEIWLSPYEVKDAEENTHISLEKIEELADCFDCWITVGNACFAALEHFECCLVEADENCVVLLAESEELKDLSDLWIELVETTDSDNEGELGFGWDIE